jgi:hypothetical protein
MLNALDFFLYRINGGYFLGVSSTTGQIAL